MPEYLPPGVSREDFQSALAEIRAIVGAAWVFADPEGDLQPYLDHMSAVPPEDRMPSAAISAASVAEVQGVLQVANKYKLPLWTYGNGKNFAYGGPSPKQAGYLVLDLKRMNRILEINEESGYCLVEPGVSYFQLYQHIQEKGYKLWIDCAAPGWGGVIGNALEHGAGYTPYADHLLFSCGMEVMLADGQLLRTGMGAMPGNNSWQLFKYGFGPYVDGMFTQGNFGIVTKMGFWLMPKPPAYKPFMATFQHEEDIKQLMDILRPLKMNMVIQNGAVIEHISYSASVQRLRKQLWDKPGLIPDERWREIAKELNLGMWNMYGALYGLPENVEMAFQLVEHELKRIPGAKIFLHGDRPADDAGWNYREKLMRGEPNMTEFNLVNWAGGGHLNFTPMAAMTGKNAWEMFNLFKELLNRHGFDMICEEVAMFRTMITLVMIMFDPRDEDARKRADACSRELVAIAKAHGYGELKANLTYMDIIADMYDGQDHALRKVNQRIKDAIDPNGILSPGKSGIWPSNWTGPRN